MRERTTFHLFIFAVTLMFSAFASGQQKSHFYQGSWNGVPCSLTINWSDYSGLAPVNGQIFITGGDTFDFKGNNTAPGRLEMTVPGDPTYVFDRRVANGKTTWSVVPTGAISFWRDSGNNMGGGGSGLPGGGAGSGLPGGGVVKPDPKTTTATGSWGGSSVSVTMNWDNYKGQGPVDGQIQYNGSTYSFSGSNPSKGYMELTIDTVNGVYRLNKSGTGTGAVWSGSLNGTNLSFGPSRIVGPGGNGGGMVGPPAPGNSTWLIACEADRSKAKAEEYAAAWRARGFSSACVIHKTQYSSLTGDKNWWVACAGAGSRAAMQSLLPKAKSHYSSAYGIKADQSGVRETFH